MQLMRLLEYSQFLLFSYRYVDSDRRFQHVLEACGVNKSLIKLGVKEGDTVIIGEVCLCGCILLIYASALYYLWFILVPCLSLQ